MRKRLFLLFLFLPALAWAAQGINWGPMIRVDDAPGLATHAAIHPYTIIDDSLRVYSVWEDNRDLDTNHSIYFSKSSTPWSTFTTNYQIIGDSLDNAYPWMVKGSSGTIYVVWQALVGSYWKIYLAKSTDDGVTFSTPDTINGVSVLNNQNSAVNFGPMPQISVDPADSFLYLVWANAVGTNPTRIKCAKSTDQGATFFGSITVNTDTTKSAKHPSVAAGDSGKVFVVYEQSNSGTSNNDMQPLICFNQSSNYADNFMANHDTVSDNFTASARRLNPSITRQSGRCLVIWEDSRLSTVDYSKPDLFFSQKYDTAANFTTNILVSKGCGDYNYRPRVGIDQTNGNLVVAWHSSLISDSTRFELRMSAYSDSTDSFGLSYKMFDTYTGNDAFNFGNAFYPPALAITNIDSITNFFMVWQDLSEDVEGNIYFRNGHVVVSQVDLDIYPNALDARGDSLDFGALPAGPAYVSKKIKIVNTSLGLNPDSLDGPSTSSIAVLDANDIILHNEADPALRILTGFISAPSPLPKLEMGQSADLTVTLYIPEGTPAGRYIGYVKLQATGMDSTIDTDSIRIVVQGPGAMANLENLKVFPNPFKYWLGHRAVNFEGLTQMATIKIYDIKGRLLATIEENNGDGLATWTPESASGVYLYLVTNPLGHKKTGKIAILR